MIKKKSKNKFEIKKSNKPLNKKRKDNNKLLKEVIEKRFNIVIFISSLFFLLITCRLFYLQVLKVDDYNEKLSYSTEKKIESSSAPRGRIYDRNYNLLVDNEAIKTIYYKKQKGITTKEEIELAYLISDNIELDYSKVNDTRLKT